MNYIAAPGLKSRRSMTLSVNIPVTRIQDIIEAVEKHFGIPMEKLKHVTRKREVCQARQICMYLLCVKTNMSLKSIAALFNRDHTSVIHARELIKDLMDTDPVIKRDILSISDNI